VWKNESKYVVEQAKEKAFVHFWVWPGPVNRSEPGDISPEAFRYVETYGAYFESILPLYVNAIAGNCVELEVRQYCYDRVRQYEIGDPLTGKRLMDQVLDHARSNGIPANEVLEAIEDPLVQPKVACEAIFNMARTRTWIEGLAALTGLEWSILQVARFENELSQFRSIFDSRARETLVRGGIDNHVGRLLDGLDTRAVDAAWELVQKYTASYAPLASQQRNIILAARDGAWAYRHYWDRIIVGSRLGIRPSQLLAG